MESKTEQQQSGNERLSWHELNSYTTAKLALRQINEALSHADNSDGKNAILRTAGEFVTEAVDAIAGKNEDGDYSKLLDKATNIGVKIVNSGLIGKATQERDHEILEVANYVGLLGMRLAEKKMDLESEEGLPNSFVKFKAVDYTIGRFKEAAKINPAWNRRISGQEFMDGFGKATNLAKDRKNQNLMKENITRARYAGSIDFRNGVAQVTSSALTHFNAGLADEKDETKIGLHERSAKLVMSMYDALVSDDALYISKKLFEDEREAFTSGRGPNAKNMYWEMDSLLDKLDTYEKLVDDAKSVVNDIARNELIANGENDTRPVDAYLLINTDKIKNFGQEMLGSVTVLFENTFAPAAQSYAKLDSEKSKKCMDAEKRVADKLVELSTLYQAWGAVFQHGDGKRVNEAEFETYQSMVKQQIGEKGA